MEAFIDGAIYPALNEAVVSEDKKRTLEREKLNGVAVVPTLPTAPESKPASPALEPAGAEPAEQGEATGYYAEYLASRNGAN